MLIGLIALVAVPVLRLMQRIGLSLRMGHIRAVLRSSFNCQAVGGSSAERVNVFDWRMVTLRFVLAVVEMEAAPVPVWRKVRRSTGAASKRRERDRPR